MKINTISTKRVRNLIATVKNSEINLTPHWKEGMSQIDILRYKRDIKDYWDNKEVRYWKLGDSYILTDFKNPYNAFCISKDYFNKNVLPLIEDNVLV